MGLGVGVFQFPGLTNIWVGGVETFVMLFPGSFIFISFGIILTVFLRGGMFRFISSL